jgi:ADP-ribosylglycohydrolase
MRSAPVGFTSMLAAERFRVGGEIGALTHGHPCGHLPAGFLAVAVGALIDGATMAAALDAAEDALVQQPQHGETLAAVRAGRELGSRGLPTPEQVETLGGGWVGEEALAIAVACVVHAPSFAAGVLAAVNHSGDSDSTGSLAGNLLGAQLGRGALPAEWLADLELADVIEQLADDAFVEFRGDPPTDEWGGAPDDWFQRYPGW